MNNDIELSIVIPTFNEEESLPHLKKEIDNVLIREKLNAEIIFIDDGSRDKSFDILQEFTEQDPKVKLIEFRRNRGKAAALDAGFSAACGKYVITMDADLQDDPNEIPNLINRLEEGFDLVSGWKKKRHDPLNKTLPSKLYNFTVSLTTGIKLHDFNCGLKIYRREVLETIRLYGELHRFIPVLAHAQGWKVGELAVTHHPRKWGVTKYGASRYIKGFLDLLSVQFITRFKTSPMHLFGSIGILSIFAGFVILAYLSFEWMMGVAIGGRPLFFLGILMMIVGLQSFSIGLVGEMLSHFFATSEKRQYKVISSREEKE